MHSITRALGVAVAGSALLLTTGVSGAAAEPRPVEKIAWSPCPEDATAECGTLQLPIDWAKPEGEKFGLAVARRKALDPAKRIGILMVNPGGPGGSGVGMALGAKGYFSPEVQNRFDIIGFDPRGIARSAAVKCSAELMARAPSQYPRNADEFGTLVGFNKELQVDCYRQSGPLWSQVSTTNVNRDMDALRVALGEQKINYFGVSYGTLIGQQYAADYGDRVRALVVDSNMDHSLGVAGFAATEAATAEDSFREWVKWCQRDSDCDFHGKDLAKEWDKLLERADRGEVKNPAQPSQLVTSQEIRQRALRAFYGPDWAYLAGYVKALIEQRPSPEALAEPPATMPNPFYSVFCQDWQMSVPTYADLARITDLENRIAPHMRGSTLGRMATASCIGAPPATNPQRPLRITKAPTVLMLNALHDPSTPYDWAVNAHRQAGKATALLTYEGWGHGAYKRSDCTRAVVDGYLLDGKLPARGARCAAVEPADGRATEDRLTPAPGFWG